MIEKEIKFVIEVKEQSDGIVAGFKDEFIPI